MSGMAGNARKQAEVLKLRSVELVEEDFSGRRLDQFNASASVFQSCDFRKTQFTHGNFGSGETPTLYLDCRFDGARLTKISAGEARFERCSFLDCNIKNQINYDAEFIDCVFGGVLQEVVFDARPWTADGSPHPLRAKNRFEGNDFRQSDLRWVSFRGGIDLTQQQLPIGPDYILIHDYATKAEAVRELVDNTEPDLHRLAARAQWLLELAASQNDNQIFARLENVCNNNQNLMRRFAELFRKP